MFLLWIFVDCGNDLLGASAIFRRHTVFEITGNGLQSIFLMADDGQATAPAIFVTAKTKTAIEISQVIDELIQCIGFILKGGSDAQAVALRKKTDDAASQGRNPGGINQLKPPPKQGDAGAGGKLAADGNQ